MTEAFHISTSGRPGPVLLDVPKDISQGGPLMHLSQTKWTFLDMTVPGRAAEQEHHRTNS